ncbi:transcription initiation factor TFIIF subunit alpha, partial [Lecanoromycetidae sp. Uapishka_2]
MSASPADRTPGRTPGQTPNGELMIMRRPKAVDPLVRPKKRQQPRAPTTNGPPPSQQQVNGVRYPGPGQSQAMPQHPGRPTPPASRPSPNPPNPKNAFSGFSSSEVAPYTDYPLVLSKRALMEGYRHHVARFATQKIVDPEDPTKSYPKIVDPRDSESFVRPVRLHRRDPRAPPAGGGGVKSEDQANAGSTDVGDKEREMQEMQKAERDAQREADRALIAPAASSGGHRKLGHNMKKTEQVWRNDQTDEQKAQSKLRYEEALPWHLEDFDNKNTWVGSYEAALSDTYGMMIHGQDGVFRIIPIEKWYKFTQKGQFKTLSIEEAEKQFRRKIRENSWGPKSEEANQLYREEGGKAAKNLLVGKWERGGGGSGAAAPITKHEDADADDLDFQEDRFADDEENMVFEEDEETKEAEKRIEKDRLQANVFDLKAEKEYEKQELLEKRGKEVGKKQRKKVKKTILKREKKNEYDTDSTDNPYSSDDESDSDDTEAERLKEAERKKAEGSQSSPEKDKLKSKPPSRANTPSHRPSKHGDPLKHSTSNTNLKRPGSPLNSEASGNESARKKHKKKHRPSPQPNAQANNNLQPPSRPGSPLLQPPSAAVAQAGILRKAPNIPAKRQRGAGSGSDTEGGAASGGEMSDGARKKIKLKFGPPSRNGTPQGSRGGSPDLPNALAPKVAQGISRPASPGIVPLYRNSLLRWLTRV